VLVELGFVTNPTEEALLASVDYQAKAAQAIAEGVARHMGLKLKSNEDPLADAVKTLQSTGIISSPDYWLENARPGKTVKGEYAAGLIQNVARTRINLFPFKTEEAGVLQDLPWNIAQVNAPSFWLRSKGVGAVVAVLDTGLDLSHPEFSGRIISPQNFSSETDVLDGNGHGTHVAGTIAGRTTGIAPEARIMPVKMLDSKGSCDNAFLIQDAFRFVLEYNKTAKEADRVVAVNCSWGGSYDPVVNYLIRELTESGVAVVAAAGNQGDGNPDTSEIWNWPGYLYEPITTGATNQDGQPAGYSSSYDGIDIGAPGTGIYSAWPGGGYKYLSGTSMATPHVTGACALIAAAWKAREGRYPTAEELEAVLFKHIKKVEVDDAFIGRGILDLTNNNKHWPLYRVQLGAYFYKENADNAQSKAQALGMSAYQVKY
jgi:major intracellular serine protease